MSGRGRVGFDLSRGGPIRPPRLVCPFHYENGAGAAETALIAGADGRPFRGSVLAQLRKAANFTVAHRQSATRRPFKSLRFEEG